MRGRRVLLAAGAAAGLAAGGWVAVTRLPAALRVAVEGTRQEEFRAPPPRVEEIQARVRAALPAVGLEAADLVEEFPTGRTDTRGTWEVWTSRWRLAAGEDAPVTGQRLASLVAAASSDLDTYVVESGSGVTEVRVYGGSRLAARLALEPTLPEWPAVGPGDPPLLAMVLDAVDHDPHASNRLLGDLQPLAVALSPYSPFTLRMARDAVTGHKEVLARVEPDTTPGEALEAVPYATGVLLATPPRGEPDAEAAALREQDIYVVDAVPEGLPAAWIRALKDAGVPRIRAVRLPPADPGEALRAFRARAAREGTGVLVVDVGDPSAQPALDSLAEARLHGFRPAFVAEVARASDPGSTARP